jgi:hypothetical protein
MAANRPFYSGILASMFNRKDEESAPPTAQPPSGVMDQSPAQRSPSGFIVDSNRVAEQPPKTAPSEDLQAAVKAGPPKIFIPDAGQVGAFNMGAGAPVGSVATNNMGVPVGQKMLPVTGAFTNPRSKAWVGVPEARANASEVTFPSVPRDAAVGGTNIPTGNINNLDAVAARSPLIAAMTNSGVLRASQEEKDTLNRLRQQGNPGSYGSRDMARQSPGIMAQAQREQYDLIGNRMARDENARQIDMQREVNQGVMAQQQARENVAR